MPFSVTLVISPFTGNQTLLLVHPAGFCALGIVDPVETAFVAFSSSHEDAFVLVDTTYSAVIFCLTAYLYHIARVCQNVAGRHKGYIQSVLMSVLGSLLSQACCTIGGTKQYSIMPQYPINSYRKWGKRCLVSLSSSQVFLFLPSSS